jgi:hypothetical protein
MGKKPMIPDKAETIILSVFVPVVSDQLPILDQSGIIPSIINYMLKYVKYNISSNFVILKNGEILMEFVPFPMVVDSNPSTLYATNFQKALFHAVIIFAKITNTIFLPGATLKQYCEYLNPKKYLFRAINQLENEWRLILRDQTEGNFQQEKAFFDHHNFRLVLDEKDIHYCQMVTQFIEFCLACEEKEKELFWEMYFEIFLSTWAKNSE